MPLRALPVLLLALGCELLANASGSPIPLTPALDFGGAALVSAPSAREVAAWYCPELHNDPVTAFACEQTIGPKPREDQMQFHFELRYAIDNPNSFPIPTTEMLAAVDVFEGRDNAELGAVCVVFCAEGDFACTGEPGATSCKADSNDIESIDDVINRLPGLIFLTLDAAINGTLDNLAQRLIPARADAFEIRVRFSLGLNAMLDILFKVVPQVVDKFLNNQPLNIEIPYAVHGTIWFEIPILGRVALGYPLFRDVWVIDADTALTPVDG